MYHLRLTYLRKIIARVVISAKKEYNRDINKKMNKKSSYLSECLADTKIIQLADIQSIYKR